MKIYVSKNFHPLKDNSNAKKEEKKIVLNNAESE